MRAKYHNMVAKNVDIQQDINLILKHDSWSRAGMLAKYANMFANNANMLTFSKTSIQIEKDSWGSLFSW